LYANGTIDQLERLSEKEAKDEAIKINLLEDAGMTNSFNINLAASAMGCNNPIKPTKFGPTLFCIAAKTLRSTRVKKATPISTGTKTISNSTTVVIKKVSIGICDYL
jgi:hypothetical protein